MYRAPLTFVALLAFGWTTMTLAADTPAPSKDAREKMAQAHDKMAACLRSDREVTECRAQMMQSCKEEMGKQGCGMGMGKMSDHGHHSGKMNTPSSTKAP